MKIVLNGESKNVDTESTVEGLLKQFNLQPERVVVELNKEILNKAIFSLTKLNDGDNVEVIQFVPGG